MTEALVKTPESDALPTSYMMRDFANKYNKSQWQKLTANKEFLEIFTLDLKKSAVLAAKILESWKPDV